MDQAIQVPKFPGEQPIIPTFASASFFKNGQEDIRLTKDDPILAQRLIDVCIHRPNASRGTQTSEKRPGASYGGMGNALQTYGQLSLENLAKDKPGSLDKDSPVTQSEKIKDLFTTGQLKTQTEVPKDYMIYVDCKQFFPGEVKACLRNGFLVVHAKHENKFETHGVAKREFTRRWRIPEDVKMNEFKCFWDDRGILVIKAPRIPTSIVVPIQI